MLALRTPTLTLLHEQLCNKLVHAKPEELDVITSVDVQRHNCIAEAKSMEWEFDLKDMWLTKSRWSMMARQYIEPNELRAWLQRTAHKMGTKGRGISVLRTREVRARGGPALGNKETRRWGSCMLALSFKAVPAPQMTLYSRTSYLGYLAALDLSVAWMAGRYLARELEMDLKDFKFVWYNEAMQYHNFKSLAYLMNHRDPEQRALYRRLMIEPTEILSRKDRETVIASPGLKLSRHWLQKVIKDDADGVTLGDMTYNTYRRIRRRFHTEVFGIEYARKFEGWSYYKTGPKKGEPKEFFSAYKELPSVPVETLDFSPIGLPLSGTYAGDLDVEEGEEIESDELDDEEVP